MGVRFEHEGEEGSPVVTERKVREVAGGGDRASDPTGGGRTVRRGPLYGGAHVPGGQAGRAGRVGVVGARAGRADCGASRADRHARGRWVAGLVSGPGTAAGQTGRTCSAWGPFWPWVTSNSTVCPLVEGPVALRGDRREMHEHVRAAVLRGDEPVSLLGVEPLHGSLHHLLLPLHDAPGRGPSRRGASGRSERPRKSRGRANHTRDTDRPGRLPNVGRDCPAAAQPAGRAL
jgi:hypothetical protein